MTLKFFDSPFHVTHAPDIASKMAMKVDLSIFIAQCIKTHGMTQNEAAHTLGLVQSRVSDLCTGKVEKFTMDAMMDILDKLGFRTTISFPSGADVSALNIAITPVRSRQQ